MIKYVVRPAVSVLYREPKLLKALTVPTIHPPPQPVSVLYREPKLLKAIVLPPAAASASVSVLYREPKLLKAAARTLTMYQPLTFQCSTVSRNC